MNPQLLTMFWIGFLATVIGCRPSVPLSHDAAERTAEPCDALAPVPSPIGYVDYGHSSGFWSSVSASFFPENRGERRNLLMAAFIDPGDKPQEALLVLESNGGDQFLLVHAKGKTRILENGQVVPVEFHEGNLDREVFMRLERAWRSMTASARWQRRDEVLSSDPGVATLHPPTKIQFDYWGNHSFSQGTTISSRYGSCTAELVSAVQVLILLVHERDSGKRQMLRDDILRRVERLSARTQRVDPDPCDDGACHSR